MVLARGRSIHIYIFSSIHNYPIDILPEFICNSASSTMTMGKCSSGIAVSEKFPSPRKILLRGDALKKCDSGTIVSMVSTDTPKGRIQGPKKCTQDDRRGKICPYVLEPFSACPTRNARKGSLRCPFSLEVCMRP
jgi:hypothetical protein